MSAEARIGVPTRLKLVVGEPCINLTGLLVSVGTETISGIPSHELSCG